ncbi:MAG: hypothetical protein ACXVEF_28125 [Polyangiales bacterium]
MDGPVPSLHCAHGHASKLPCWLFVGEEAEELVEREQREQHVGSARDHLVRCHQLGRIERESVQGIEPGDLTSAVTLREEQPLLDLHELA